MTDADWANLPCAHCGGRLTLHKLVTRTGHVPIMECTVCTATRSSDREPREFFDGD